MAGSTPPGNIEDVFLGMMIFGFYFIMAVITGITVKPGWMAGAALIVRSAVVGRERMLESRRGPAGGGMAGRTLPIRMSSWL